MGLCEYWYMIEYSMVGIEHINPRTPSRAPAHAGARGRTRAHAGARGRTRAHAGLHEIIACFNASTVK